MDYKTGTTKKWTPVESVSKENSFVGYYADLEGDGNVDGIIYADLAFGNTASGNWGGEDGDYTISKVDNIETLKDYYISQTNFNGVFGAKDVLSVDESSNGDKDRFYVMDLENLGSTNYYWYKNARGKMSDFDTATSTDFGTGERNTIKMKEYWDLKKYAEQDERDMWGVNIKEGWFIPSRDEWAAFAEELDISKDNYTSKNMKNAYWSSSQDSASYAFRIYFGEGYMSNVPVTNSNYLRLTTTF